MDAVLERADDGSELKAIPQDADESPTRAEAEAAVRTLLRWAGDDPTREGLIDTPKRVVKAYEEFFNGYKQDIGEILSRTFDEVTSFLA